MISLIVSEWERLWSRKITWLIFILIPIVLFATGRYYKSLNEGLTPKSPEYTVLDNFPVLALSEQLMTAFNMVLLILLVFSITEEYCTGQIRMVMIRSYSFSQLLFAKWFTVLGVMFLFHGLYLILSYVFGAWMFESSPQLFLFFHDEPVSGGPAFSYNIRYYGIAFITLMVVSLIFTFFAVISKSTTTAIGLSIGFLLASIAYPVGLRIFTTGMESPLDPSWYFLSITQIQHEGIALALAQQPKLIHFNTGVLLAYAFTFGIAAYLIFTKKDRFI